MYVILTAQRRTAPVMAGGWRAGQQLYWAADRGQVDEVRLLLDQGVHPDEFREVSAAPPPGAVPRALPRRCFAELTLCCVHAGVLCGSSGTRR